MNKKTFKTVIISVIILLFIFGIYLFLIKFMSTNDENDHLKNYDVNEYIPTYVSAEDLAKIYLNDYLYNMRYKVEEAYSLLDNEYSNKKFSGIEEFKTYISSFVNDNIIAKKYYRTSKKGYIYYYVYDENDNVFIFKTKGVMQYSVYLDEDTIEIGD